MTASCDEMKELPGFSEKSTKTNIMLRDMGILILPILKLSHFPANALQQNIHLGRIYPLPGYRPSSVNPSKQRSSPKQDDIMYKLLLAEREDTARVKEIMKHIENEDKILCNLLLSERKEKRQLRDQQRYVEREKIQMKERELIKYMEKVREAREKHEVDNNENEHNFVQLSERKFPVGPVKVQLEKNKISSQILNKLPVSPNIVSSGWMDTSCVPQEGRNTSER
jgi:hypothetical protein